MPQIWILILEKARPKLNRIPDLTVRQIYREVAKLGGFLGRKGDGEPGWITLWRGWEKLNNYEHGASLALKLESTHRDLTKSSSLITLLGFASANVFVATMRK